MYAWGYSTYRRTGQASGVTSITAYRWVSAWGYELLPVAALFGVVKSSGVVGVDEKYVLVPKNDKPEGKMRRWMYVYFAVDVYTYDLSSPVTLTRHNEDGRLVWQNSDKCGKIQAWSTSKSSRKEPIVNYHRDSP
jgi:hypothetical protein